jgi:hypothetical protein
LWLKTVNSHTEGATSSEIYWPLSHRLRRHPPGAISFQESTIRQMATDRGLRRALFGFGHRGAQHFLPLAYRRWFCESATGELIFYGLFETAPLNGYTHTPNPTTEKSAQSTKRHAPHCPPKTAVSTPLHLPLSTRLDEISCR